jgi:predicted AAA+ superfamily ATPase
MWIKRDSENLIRELGKQFPVVFVTGARQVGKTSILIHLFLISYVTLDDLRGQQKPNIP